MIKQKMSMDKKNTRIKPMSTVKIHLLYFYQNVLSLPGCVISGSGFGLIMTEYTELSFMIGKDANPSSVSVEFLVSHFHSLSTTTPRHMSNVLLRALGHDASSILNSNLAGCVNSCTDEC